MILVSLLMLIYLTWLTKGTDSSSATDVSYEAALRSVSRSTNSITVSSSSLQKRTPGAWRPIDTCPEGWHFAASSCEAFGQYVVQCTNDRFVMEKFYGTCRSDEVCQTIRIYDNPFPFHPWETTHPMAVCFAPGTSKQTVDVQQRQKNRDAELSPGRKQNIRRANSANAAAAVALVSKTDPSVAVNASQIQISAQSTKRLFGAVAFSTLADGLAACTNCASLGMAIPTGTEVLDIKVKLPNVGDTANMYTFSGTFLSLHPTVFFTYSNGLDADPHP
ncbi:hypothetical protein MMC20_007131 [Loxospora ochrophaea]|nr:hypothetical protein [Loxospora ochrophaea]